MSTKFITQSEVYQKLTNGGGGTNNFATKSWITETFPDQYEVDELNKCSGDNWFVIDDYVVSNCYELTLNQADNYTIKDVYMKISSSRFGLNSTELVVVFKGEILDGNGNKIDINRKTAIVKIPKSYYYSITSITYTNTSSGGTISLTPSLDTDKTGITFDKFYQMTGNKTIDIYSTVSGGGLMPIGTFMNIENTKPISYYVQIDSGEIINVAANSTSSIGIPSGITSFSVHVWTDETLPPYTLQTQWLHIQRGDGTDIESSLDVSGKQIIYVYNYTAGENITLYI